MLFNSLNIRFIQIWTNSEICIWGLTGIVLCCFRPRKLALMCSSCMHHILPWVASCSLVMHHTWLSIMSCSCVVCLPCCVLLLDSSCFIAIVRIRSSTIGLASSVRLLHGLVLLPCGISGKMTLTLDLITIIAMLVASFYRYAALPSICSSSLPIWHVSL